MSIKAKSSSKRTATRSPKGGPEADKNGVDPRSSTMFRTRNDLSKKTRQKIVRLCNQNLADLKDLQTQLKQAHWNVKGPQFIALHELFDTVNGEVEGYVDLVAERAVQLGGVANGTARQVAAHSRLPEYPANAVSGEEHTGAVSQALSQAGQHVRGAISAAEKAGDADTADIFTEISRGLDKSLWFVEAHLES